MKPKSLSENFLRFAASFVALVGPSGAAAADVTVPDSYGVYAVRDGESERLDPNPDSPMFVDGMGNPSPFRQASDVEFASEDLSFVVYAPMPLRTGGRGHVTAFLVDRLVGRVHLGMGDDPEWHPYDQVWYRLREDKGVKLRVAPMEGANNLYRLSLPDDAGEDPTTARIAIPIQTRGSRQPTFFDVLLDPSASDSMGRCSVLVQGFAPGDKVVSCDKAAERWPAVDAEVREARRRFTSRDPAAFGVARRSDGKAWYAGKATKFEVQVFAGTVTVSASARDALGEGYGTHFDKAGLRVTHNVRPQDGTADVLCTGWADAEDPVMHYYIVLDPEDWRQRFGDVAWVYNWEGGESRTWNEHEIDLADHEGILVLDYDMAISDAATVQVSPFITTRSAEPEEVQRDHHRLHQGEWGPDDIYAQCVTRGLTREGLEEQYGTLNLE